MWQIEILDTLSAIIYKISLFLLLGGKMSVIMLSAKRGHGKDTVCDMMIKKLVEKGKVAQRFAFSD